MKEEPLLAVVIPVYNAGPYFRQCLEHIQNQTYKNWICCITDNASTDGTNAIAKEFAEKDSRFRVFRNPETVFICENFNIAYSHILDLNAKYSKVEPGDDWSFPECFEKMVEVLESDEQVGACFAYSLKGKDVYCDGLDVNEGNVYQGKDLIHKYLKNEGYYVGCVGTPMYRVDALKQLNPNLAVYNEKNFHNDIQLAHDILINWKAGFVHQVLTFYRLHSEQGLAIALRLNTDLFGKEYQYATFLSQFDDIQEEYRQHRLDYALFYLQKRRNKEFENIQWHDKYLVEYLNRPITKEEQNAAIRREIKKNVAEIYRYAKRLIKSFLLYIYRK